MNYELMNKPIIKRPEKEHICLLHRREQSKYEDNLRPSTAGGLQSRRCGYLRRSYESEETASAAGAGTAAAAAAAAGAVAGSTARIAGHTSFVAASPLQPRDTALPSIVAAGTAASPSTVAAAAVGAVADSNLRRSFFLSTRSPQFAPYFSVYKYSVCVYKCVNLFRGGR